MKKIAVLGVLFAASLTNASVKNANAKITSSLSEKQGSLVLIKVSAQSLCSDFPSITSNVRALDEKTLAVSVQLFDNCGPNQVGDKERQFLISVDPAAEAANLGLTTLTPELYVQVQ